MRSWKSLVLAGALGAGTQAVLAAPSLASDVAAPGHNAVTPCQGAQLHTHVNWTVGAGYVDGQITVINETAAPCALPAYPQIRMAAGGTHLGVTESHAPIGPAGVPVHAMELLRNQQVSMSVHWETICVRRPFSLVLTISLARGEEVTVPVRPVARAGCTTPAAHAQLLVSPFRPGYDPGIVDLLAFYGLINTHQFLAAYRETADQQASPTHFVAGYVQTRHVAIDLLAVPPYRVESAGGTYACVGIRLTAYQRTGAHRVYGGWMMTEVRGGKVGWVVPDGGRLRLGGPAVIPPRAACAAAIPTPLMR